MTKVTFIGQAPTKESKHIELVKVYPEGTIRVVAKNWDNCQLIKRNAKNYLDLILCFDHSGNAAIYLGHWNDGTTSNPETVCTVLGEDVAVKKGKGIEFVKYVFSDSAEIKNIVTKPSGFKNVEVVKYGERGCFDIFYAYNDDRTIGGIYLGHLNDGFVE
jgi:hypothetical protein